MAWLAESADGAADDGASAEACRLLLLPRQDVRDRDGRLSVYRTPTHGTDTWHVHVRSDALATDFATERPGQPTGDSISHRSVKGPFS